MNYSTQLDRALTRQETMETRDADAEAIRELWEIARKKEQDRRQVQRGEIPITPVAAGLAAATPQVNPCEWVG